ncbi:uncharacterized protein LOC129803836 isoform X2 [Phlebotomus papatasi]|uniref:uncharacterized protein LOC129803836 isoform X2 n=1 Tax=Phlebotomus papatasi TaxID=29031 RepID=UPI0024846CD7|nr:uncharacterized protein LOC129803836 isoform X2 [Phlebotomus papatasi]
MDSLRSYKIKRIIFLFVVFQVLDLSLAKPHPHAVAQEEPGDFRAKLKEFFDKFRPQRPTNGDESAENDTGSMRTMIGTVDSNPDAGATEPEAEADANEDADQRADRRVIKDERREAREQQKRGRGK